jgi:hypothetical protein
VEARDGIEPSSKALQTLPFSFWVPRHLSQRWHSDNSEAIVTKIRAAIPTGRLHEIPPPKESMKKLVENRRLRRSIRHKSQFASRIMSNHAHHLVLKR